MKRRLNSGANAPPVKKEIYNEQYMDFHSADSCLVFRPGVAAAQTRHYHLSEGSLPGRGQEEKTKVRGSLKISDKFI
jgi:hypothetical protein